MAADDLEASTKQAHDFGKGLFPARERASCLVARVINEPADCTECVLLDADAFAAEPVARVLLPRRIPPGFHGDWAPLA